MVWQVNGTPDTLTVAGDDNDITDLTDLKFNQFLRHELVSGNVSSDVTFNDNGNSVYATRTNNDGGSGGTDTTVVSQTKLSFGLANFDEFVIMNVVSITGEEKLGSLHIISAEPGAAFAPQRREQVFKFVPSPDAGITRIDFTNISGGSYAIGTNISALADVIITPPILEFASLYESFQALTSIQVSHFVEWFSGSVLDSIWTTASVVGSPVFAMDDAIDGGFKITSATTTNELGAIAFNNKRHYDFESAVCIGVTKTDATNQRAVIVGFAGLVANSNIDDAFGGIESLFSTTKFVCISADATTESATATDVDLDTDFHVNKIELNSTQVLYTLDGVLKVTKTTNRPTVKLQPIFLCQRQGADMTGSIRYLEAFNTSVSILSSLYERLSALTQVANQRVVETFSGSVLNERWTGTGTGSAPMDDSIDGGCIITTGALTINEFRIDFNDIEQYDFEDSVVIGVVKIASISDRIMEFGFRAVTSFARVLFDTNVGTVFQLSTFDGTTFSATDSSITADTVYHTHKIETGSANTLLTIDGVLEVTKSTNRPIAKMQPFAKATTRTNAVKTTNILYCEAYNKLTTETDFPSVYELFNPLITISKQHFWDWFDGNDVSNRWTKQTSVGSPTFTISDSIDGGFELTNPSSANSQGSINFNDKRPFDPVACEIIFVLKSSSTSVFTDCIAGFQNTLISPNNAAFAGFNTDQSTTNFMLHTGDNSTNSSTTTSVTGDTSFHSYKIECGSVNITLTMDGVLEITKTTNRPTLKMQSFIENQAFNNTGARTTSVRYIEAFNT